MRVAYPDHDEVISSGDAYYAAPGHLAIRLDDSEVVAFTPAAIDLPQSRSADITAEEAP